MVVARVVVLGEPLQRAPVGLGRRGRVEPCSRVVEEGVTGLAEGQDLVLEPRGLQRRRGAVARFLWSSGTVTSSPQ
jgi:hypothetical protein